ncbi:MAG: hypothetical protein KAH46_23370, partial [Mycobacterium sp.]|nr:hypothetical protein [Mycobacterium sp.]
MPVLVHLVAPACRVTGVARPPAAAVEAVDEQPAIALERVAAALLVVIEPVVIDLGHRILVISPLQGERPYLLASDRRCK